MSGAPYPSRGDRADRALGYVYLSLGEVLGGAIHVAEATGGR